MTLYWLVINGSSPLIPLNKVLNDAAGRLCSGDIAPLLKLDNDNGKVSALVGDTGSNKGDSLIRRG